MLPVLLQTLKEQFLDVEAILAGLQHNILEPECLASLDQNYYVTVRTLYKRGLRNELDTLRALLFYPKLDTFFSFAESPGAQELP